MTQQHFVKVKASFDQANSSFDLPSHLTWADLSVIIETLAAQIGSPLNELKLTGSNKVAVIPA